MKTIYIPWTRAALHRKPAVVKPTARFSANVRLIEVSNRLASQGVMLHWNPRLRGLEAVPYRTR